MVGIFIVFLLNNLLWLVFCLLLIATLQNQPVSRMLVPKKQKPDELFGEENYQDATNDQLLAGLDTLEAVYQRKKVTTDDEVPVE